MTKQTKTTRTKTTKTTQAKAPAKKVATPAKKTATQARKTGDAGEEEGHAGQAVDHTAAAKTRAKRLAEYTAKRDFAKTPEPAGGATEEPSGHRRFVVQRHRARACTTTSGSRSTACS